ncbi:DUF3306 domain-containing protein [Mameliella alba]|nr:DUF3306 domain-containing protein [Mameliella alba]MBY6169303.1 DUF3306 domain-containing protein [Mameliella alba]MBY6174322.1 DUF3306 domain-containing protein [Mameliella alba]
MSDTRGNFWSRRRAAVAAEQQAEAQAQVAEARAAEAAAIEEQSDDEVLEELGLPAPEDMTDPAQVQELLRSVVPQRLRTRALRRLWRLNPVLANVDGLVDYGEDFTDAALAVEKLQTVYQVGKGMFDKAAEQAEAEARAAAARDAETPEAEATEAEGTAQTADEAPDQVRGAPPDTADPGAAGPAPAPEPGPLAEIGAPAEPEAPATASRRMRFRFETAT